MDQVYHVYNRGINRQDIFYSHEEYKEFLGLVRKNLPRYAIDLYAYTLKNPLRSASSCKW